MAVPTSLASLSTTPGSNPPGGAENPFPELDDHLRAIYAFVAALRDQNAPLNNPAFTGSVSLPASTTAIGDGTEFTGVYLKSGRSGGSLHTEFVDGRHANNIPHSSVSMVANTDGSSSVDVRVTSVGSTSADRRALKFRVTDADGPSRFDDASTANGLVRKSQLDSAVSAAFTAGDTKFSYQAADHGRWLMITGPQRTIGNAGSGATARANADTLALYTLLWSLDAADVAIYTSTGAASTRGASAAADFAALKHIDLPNESGLVSKGHHGGNGALTTNTTRRLGSVEMDDVKAHTHVANIDANVGTSNSRSSNLVWGDRGPDSTKSVTTTSTGGPENLVRNRSKNAFIYF